MISKMNIEEKKQFVSNLKTELDESSILLTAHYAGVTVDQMNSLRSVAKKNEVNVKVVKNSLSKLAIKDTEFDDLSDELQGPIILLYAEDIVAAAKVLVDFAKNNGELVLRTGSYNKSLIGKDDIINISKMPSLDEVRAKLISLLQTPATKIAAVLQAPARDCVGVVSAYSKKS